MTRAVHRLLAAVWCAAATAAPAADTVPPGPSPATAHVTYVAASSIYVDAGSAEGLKEGDTIEVIRNDGVVATLTVSYVSTHRASCTYAGSAGAVVVGDVVRFTPSAPVAAPPPPETAPRRSSAEVGLHGRVGLRYLGVVDRSGHDGGYSEPAADIRLSGNQLNGAPVDLDVDIRARRSSSTLWSGETVTTARMRAYSVSATYRFAENQRVTFGRQYATVLDGLEIFDGALYEYDGARWGGGVLAGFQPDLVDLSFSTDVRELAGYVGVHNLPGSKTRWGFTTGVVGAFAADVVSREYLFLQGTYFSKFISFYGSQEIDYNSGWKVDIAHQDTVELTGTFASLRVHAASWVDLNAGYDNRKNVYQYWDYISPLTVFDDTNRRGLWGGATFRIGEHWDIGAEAREIQGATPGPANSYTLAFGASGYTRAALSVRFRGTHFSNLQSNGNLLSLAAGASVATGLHLEISGGRIDETNVDPALDRQVNWLGLDVDYAIGRHWYLLLSLERDDGDFEKQDQIYGAVMYRF